MIATIIVGFGVFLLVVSIIILVFKSQKDNITFIKSNNPEELKKFMEEHNFPQEMIQNMTENGTNIVTTTTTTKVEYVNGQKVSEETHNFNSNITPLTNCPNCGAMIEPGNNGVCRFCNTTFNTYQINK